MSESVASERRSDREGGSGDRASLFPIYGEKEIFRNLSLEVANIDRIVYTYTQQELLEREVMNTCDYCGTVLTDHIVRHGDYLACEVCEVCEEPRVGEEE